MNEEWYDIEFRQIEEDLENGIITLREYNRAQEEIEREIASYEDDY